jgi:hypothetical protein
MPESTTRQPAVDRNLVLFVLAVQMKHLSGEALIAGLNAWSTDKSQSLGDLLVQRGALSRDQQTQLEGLLAEHLTREGSDTATILESIRRAGPVQLLDLGQIADASVRACLNRWDKDSPGTLPPEHGTTSEGAAGFPARPLPAPLWNFGDNYEILMRVAAGGMGVIYKARQIKANRLVALKTIQAGLLATPRQVERFRREAQAVADLHHPGIVTIFDVGEVNGEHYFSMEWLGAAR